MIRSLEQARSEVLSTVGVLGAERVPIWEARGRVLAADVVAPEDVPPFPNSGVPAISAWICW